MLPWIALVILVLGSAGMAAHYWQQNLTINQIVVTGNYFTPKIDILEQAGIEIGIKPDSVNLDKVKLQIERLNYVHSITPYIDPIGRVKLSVKERNPIALLVKGGQNVYVDADGVRLPIIAGKTIDLPLVYGFDTRLSTDTLKSPEFTQIRDFLIGAVQSPLSWATISEVAYDPDIGVVALSHENGVKLLFGLNEFETKLRNWEAFYTHVVNTKGIRRMQQIDLRFSNQVITREVES